MEKGQTLSSQDSRESPGLQIRAIGNFVKTQYIGTVLHGTCCNICGLCFYGSLRRPHASHSSGGGGATSVNSCAHRLLENFDNDVFHLKLLKSRYIYFRFCPAMMFVGEALCRLWIVVVVALVALRLRRNMFEFIDRTGPVTVIERILVGLLGSNLLYEYGQMCHHTTDIFPSPGRVRMHLQQGWNQCNIVGLFLVALWAAFTFFCAETSVSTRSHVALGCLATSTILFATGLLRYLSILELLESWSS